MSPKLKRVLSAAWLMLCLAAVPAMAAEAPKVSLISRTDKIKQVEASVTIDAPPSSVWAMLTDYRHLKKVLPDYERTDVISEHGNGATMDLAVKAGAMAPTFRYRVRIHENRAANILTIQRLSGDFNAITATYKMMPAAGGNKTILVYHLNIDLGGKFPLPGANHMLKNSTHKSMAAMQRACAESYRHALSARR